MTPSEYATDAERHIARNVLAQVKLGGSWHHSVKRAKAQSIKDGLVDPDHQDRNRHPSDIPLEGWETGLVVAGELMERNNQDPHTAYLATYRCKDHGNACVKMRTVFTILCLLKSVPVCHVEGCNG